MNAVIFANGEIVDYEAIAAKLTQVHTCIAVDGGLRHCYALGITPHLLVGDMDSIHPEILAECPPLAHSVYPRDKDESDLEIALDTLDFDQFDNVTVYGALGGNTDHIQGNLFLLSRYPNSLEYITETEKHMTIEGNAKLHCPEGTKVSLFPIYGPVKVTSTVGLKWPIEDMILDSTYFSLSNEATTNQIEINVEDGKVLLILTDR